MAEHCVDAGKWVPVDTTFVMPGWGPELRSAAPPPCRTRLGWQCSYKASQAELENPQKFRVWLLGWSSNKQESLFQTRWGRGPTPWPLTPAYVHWHSQKQTWFRRCSVHDERMFSLIKVFRISQWNSASLEQRQPSNARSQAGTSMHNLAFLLYHLILQYWTLNKWGQHVTMYLYMWSPRGPFSPTQEQHLTHDVPTEHGLAVPLLTRWDGFLVQHRP